MRTADSLAISVPPLLLRLVLAITFTWAGLGKIAGTMEVSPADAAILAQMKVTPAATPAPTPTDPLAAATPGDAAEPAATPAVAPATPGRVGRVNGIAILLHRSANPASTTAPDGTVTTPMPLWPAWAASGSLPVALAWTVAITELLAGLFLLIGFLTRFAGLAVAGVMAGAIWLTQVGPAVQSGKTLLGFLPVVEPWYEIGWMPLMWQTALLFMGLALVFSGGGALSIDRAVSARDDDDEFDDDDHGDEA